MFRNNASLTREQKRRNQRNQATLTGWAAIVTLLAIGLLGGMATR